MDEGIRKTLEVALAAYRGADYERTVQYYANYTPEKMCKPIGKGAPTPRAILTSLKKHVDRVEAARKFVEQLK